MSHDSDDREPLRFSPRDDDDDFGYGGGYEDEDEDGDGWGVRRDETEDLWDSAEDLEDEDEEGAVRRRG